MNKLVLSILLISHLTVSMTLEYSELVDPYTALQNPCSDIRNGKFICLNCGTLGFCLQQDGAWTTLKVTECQTEHSLYCDEDARGCIFKQSCKESTRGPKFECQNAGIFPDPYDCKYYYVCDNMNEKERLICHSGTAYSPANKTCSLSTTSDICLQPQYECKAFGQMAAWPTDPSIYYVCHSTNVGGDQIRYPVLYHCRTGYIFVTNRCVPDTAVPENKKCQMDRDLIENPNDCNSYLVCANEIWVSAMCPVGTHFSNATKSCVFGKC